MGINYYFIRAVYSWPEIKDNPTFPVRGDNNERHLNPEILHVTHIKQLAITCLGKCQLLCDSGLFIFFFRWLGWHSITLLLMCHRWQSDKNGSKLYKTHAFEEKDISRPLLSLSSCRGWRTGLACMTPSSPPSAISPFSSCSSCPQWCQAGHGGCIFTFLLSMLATLSNFMFKVVHHLCPWHLPANPDTCSQGTHLQNSWQAWGFDMEELFQPWQTNAFSHINLPLSKGGQGFCLSKRGNEHWPAWMVGEYASAVTTIILKCFNRQHLWMKKLQKGSAYCTNHVLVQ